MSNGHGQAGCSTFDPLDIWLGMDYYMMDEGERCDTHCAPCNIDVVKPGVSDGGGRWLESSERYPSRDAWGKFHALRSNEPHLYPPSANFTRGSCYNNAGQECKGKVCHCDPQIEADWGEENDWVPGEDCRDGTTSNRPRTSYFADMIFTTGNQFTDYGDWLDCRTEKPPQLYSLPVTMQRGRINQMATARSGFCTSNILVWTVGRRHRNFCSELYSDNYPYGPEYFNNPALRVSDWNIMYVSDLSPQLVNSARYSQNAETMNAVRDCQNAALAYASQYPNPCTFDQMTHVNFSAPDADLGHWFRGWTADTDAPPHVYKTLDNCSLRYSGLPVVADLIVLSGHIELDLVLHRVQSYNDLNNFTAGFTYHLYASPRFRMHLDLGVRAMLTDGNIITLHNGTPLPLTIHNSTSAARRYPLLHPTGYDTIVYRDDQGREFTPPTEVDWWGSRQHPDFTDEEGAWPDLFDGIDEPGGAIQDYCHSIAELLNEQHKLTIAGAPDVFTESPRIQHYGGSVQVHLTTI